MLSQGSSQGQLTAISSDLSIPGDNPANCRKDLTTNDCANLKVCNCGLVKTVVDHIIVDLTDDPTAVSSANGSAVVSVSNTWVSTPLYTLHIDNKQEIVSSDGWLSEKSLGPAVAHLAGILKHSRPARSGSSQDSVVPNPQRRICADHLCCRLSLVYNFQHWM